MSAGSICTRTVYTATPTEKAVEAARRMKKHRVGSLVVVDVEQRPVGMVTDRDLAIRCIADELGGQAKLETLMTRPLATIREDTPIDEALRHMAATHVRRMVVVDSAGDLVGILALDDVMELLAYEVGNIGKLLHALVPG